ncbi:MAG: DUF4230 domain-containing protein [Synergistaceae bacterium]|nr:DUF4230 domain-containing protein [Synergistaceae bacterium]
MTSIVIGLIIAAFIIGLVVMWRIKGLFGIKNVVRSSSVLDAVKKVNELVTLRSYFQHVIEDKQKTIALGVTISESKILIVCKGEVVCRFDMSKAEINVNEENKHAGIKMPQCELQTIIDTSNVNVHDSTRGVIDFVKDTITFNNTYDYNKVRDIIERERPVIAEEAKKDWHLIDKAKENARQVLENLMSAFGYRGEIFFAED